MERTARLALSSCNPGRSTPRFASFGENWKKRLSAKILAAAGILCLVAGAHTSGMAADAVSVEAATGNQSGIARVGAQWNWQGRWWESNGTHIGGYWDASLAQWWERRFQDIPGAHRKISSIGITPVLRYQNDSLKGFFWEAGIGAHLLSGLYDNNGRLLSSKFQFGDHIGIGYDLQNNLELGLSFQHFSNGGIKKPNGGLNLAVARLRYRF